MKDIPGYEGRYAITEDGRVWSYPKPLTGVLEGKGTTKGRFLKPVISAGYWTVATGAGRLGRIHRLLAMTYLPRVEGKDHVNHKNGIKTDNRLENLEWCTQAENNRHGWETGLMRPARRVNLSDVASIRERFDAGEAMHKIAADYGVGRSTIQRVIAGSHGYGAAA